MGYLMPKFGSIKNNFSIYIYIYIYMCVCVCVWFNDIDIDNFLTQSAGAAEYTEFISAEG